MRAGEAYGRKLVLPVLCSLYGYDMATPSHHVELSAYVDETAVMGMYHQQTLLVASCRHLHSVEYRLQVWGVTTNISECVAVLSFKTER